MKIILTVDDNWNFCPKSTFNFKQNNEQFNKLTNSKVVVMDEDCLFALNNGQALKNRINICYSSSIQWQREGVFVVSTMEELFEKLASFESDNVYVIGSPKTINLLIPYCNTAYVTKVITKTAQPDQIINLDKQSNWKLNEMSNPYFENGTVFYFCTYQNQSPKKYNWAIKPDLL